MPTETATQEFHNRAKQAGDQLRTYIVSISAAATGMLFLNLTEASGQLTGRQKAAVAVAIIMFSLTVLLTLVELHLNARRFFELAKQQGQDKPNWTGKERLEAVRFKVMWCSYGAMIVAVGATLIYMLMRI